MSKINRLYGYFKPENYRLALRPYQKSRSFVAVTAISGELEKARRNITLHTQDLDIETAWVIFGKYRIELSEVKPNASEQEVNLIFKRLYLKEALFFG
ncbi:MAG: hypothetical protein WDZ81_01250 [Candidatus Saccharimonadales bacterium]